ncbi:MAG: sugar phosphate isomerase/epimerase [Armatimonadetes bacterium]|nr:sugar phosphate isomerase/epimerase [Armatimonadota bacterium]MDW8121548.1 sugar phosphate isomerase/epimerase [Armatimonadota bacterium]
MGIGIGINLEFVRHADKPFDYGAQKAAELGYEYVEPCVATGRDLLAEAGYYHMLSMEEDPLYYKDLLDRLGLKVSGLSAHSPLMKPEVAVPYLTQAIRWAADIGAPVVNTDEGPKQPWIESDEEAFEVMRYTLKRVVPVAERHGILIGLEPHQIYTVRKETFLKLLDLVPSSVVKVNYDTGNAFLAGNDPVEYLEAVADRVVHVHAKDIAYEHAEAERGKVTGTPVGCACGEGLIDWPAVVRVLRKAGFNGVLSVECGTEDQAERSIQYLKKVLAEA